MLHKPLDLPYEHSEYEGIPIASIIPSERYKEIIKTHKSRPDDVYIATYPKSGTTWLQHIVNQMLGEPRGSDLKIVKAIPWAAVETQSFIDNLSSPRVLKTHMKWCWVPKGDGVKYIYCYRNPKDVVVSYYHYVLIMKYFNYNDSFDEYYSKVFMDKRASMYGGYFDHVSEWLQQRDNKNILFLTYEDLIEDLVRGITRIERFLKLELSEEMKLKIASNSSFSTMKSNSLSNYSWVLGSQKSFIRKGKVGDWVNYLSEKQSQEIEEMVKKRLIPLGARIRFILSDAEEAL